MVDRDPGLYQFDTNQKWSFYQIAFALNKVLDKGWKITATDTFVFDQRMVDPRMPAVSLKSRLPSLK
jgi:dTDP-4-dehydrorhamnose reductase